MNLLAHLKLSGKNEHIMLGNFIADHIKGNKLDKYPQEIIMGVMLHRKIDFYTDHHPEFMKSRDRLHENYHKYAGVIVDILYDHFLAVNWKLYSDIKLANYVAFSYGILLKHYSFLPKKTKTLLPFMIMQNWLMSYRSFDGLQRTFEGMSRRAKFKSNMENVVVDFQKDYSKYEKEFLAFFPDIMNYAEEELEKIRKEYE
jgi:acyl carrier protein phosphodiesterase